jgi:hypothetical protein
MENRPEIETVTIEQLVYGELGKLLNLKIEGEISEVAEIYRKLRNLEKSFLIGYATFIVAQGGFCNKTLCEKWKIEGTFDPTLENKWDCSSGCSANPKVINSSLSDLMICSLPWAEELNKLWDEYGEVDKVVSTLLNEICYSYSNYFENVETKERIKFIFTENVSSESLKSFNTFRESRIGKLIDSTCKNYILIDPKENNTPSNKTIVEFERLQKLLYGDKVQIVMAGNLPDEFIKADIEKALGNWVTLRNRALEEFKIDYPVLVKALERKEFETIDKKLKKAGRACEDGRFEDAVKDAGSACESLLDILYHRVNGKPKPKEPIGRTLGMLKTNMEGMFGAPVYHDLNFIISTRNDATHPRTLPIEITKRTALQVIERTKIFYELLKVELEEKK